ncbi:MAG: anthranilate phosphoribosyltransferase [Desulfofustis sp.]|nr:anthranilate phosphoribosyltransferase [Desulfofustis sp.]
MDIRDAFKHIVEQKNLTETQMYEVISSIMNGEVSEVMIAAFLTGLRMKGETVDEITGAVRVMREKATPIETGVDIGAGGVVIDTCGTGGDGSGTFNVSTTSAFVVAGCGVTVAKHGNRAVSSSCGSADVLEAAGVNLDLSPHQVSECIRNCTIGFLFAPALHGAMKYAIGPRREIGIRTVFNILGPLTNPAGANVQVVGVFSEKLIVPLAEVLGKLGARRALVVHGEGNLDELTVTGTTSVADFKEGRVSSYQITPEEFGLTRAAIEDLQGGSDAAGSARMMKDILSGELGPKREMVLLNAGAALMAAGKAKDIGGGIALAADCIDSGKAVNTLESLVSYSQGFE